MKLFVELHVPEIISKNPIHDIMILQIYSQNVKG